MNASDFCFVCGTPGFFPAEDNLLCPDCTRVHAVDDEDVEIVDGMEYCALCFCHGFFPAEDNFFCPDCTRWMLTGTVAMPSDDDESGDTHADEGYDYDPFFDMGEDYYFPEEADDEGGD